MKGTVSLSLSGDPRLTNWLTAEAAANQGLVPSIYASTDAGKTIIPLRVNSDNPTAVVGEFTPELNLSGGPVDRVVEFYLAPELSGATNHQLLIGTYAVYSVPAAVFLTEADFAITYPSFPADDITFAEDDAEIRLGYTFNQDKGATWTGPADFYWGSSDTAIASISSDGRILITGSKTGPVTFALTATNGGVKGKAVSLASRTLTVKAGLTPFLQIPKGANVIPTKQGSNAEIRWTSNLIAKNAEEGKNTEFTVEVFTADYVAGAVNPGQSVYSQTMSGTQESPVSSHIIPAEVLKDVSVIGRYSYIAQVSSTNPITQQKLTAEAYIAVLSQPAVVKLGRLPNYSVTDSVGNVAVNWTLSHFDTVNGGDFCLFVNRNDEATPLYSMTTTDNSGGSYQLEIPPVANRLKDVYTVTVRAKNSADSTWSYDSFVLYVYNSSALKIWIDGLAPGGDLNLSNVETVSNMSSADILAMQRDIYLKKMISINYGDYAWGQISDQIRWQSSDSAVASVNYRQGSLYENIESFSYLSYRPATEFILSGLRDGTTRVTVTHAATGMQRTLDVQVSTLKDKLYLFQVYPRATTTLTYTNGDGEKRMVNTDSNGALALFEDSGIESDVYLQSTFNERDYRGTIYKERLVSSEKDSTKLELYPENNIKLREVATAEMYFKLPDGTPYQGDVILRGGVYKNGQYCPEALLNGLTGEEDQTISVGTDGKFTVKMDATQFWTASDDEVLKPQDKLQFIFEVRYPHDAYYPQLLTVDGNLNISETVRFAAGIVDLTEVAVGEAQKPFVESQQLLAPGSSAVDVKSFSGKIGPGGIWSSVALKTRVFWWGDTAESGQGLHRLSLQDQYGTVPLGQTSKTFRYPFSSIRVTEHALEVNRDIVQGWLGSGESRGMKLFLTDGEGRQYKQLTLPFKIINMFGMPSARNSNSLPTLLGSLKGYSAANARAITMSVSDSFINAGLQFISGRGVENQMFTMVIRPTADPTVFKALIMLNIGNMSNDNATGVYADDNINSDIDYLPSISAAQQMAKGKYISEQMDKYNYNKNNASSQREREISYTFGGYMEAEITYNYEKSKWESLVLSGGFNAGGGVSYSWNYNAWVGPVPVTAQLTVGGTAEVIFKAAVQRGDQVKLTYNQDAVNDYLTTLRLYAYIRVFGGVGVDYTVFALKIGIFGQISIDAQFAFLNQPYKSSTATTGQKLLVKGITGIEFVAKFLFVKYEKVLASWPFDIANESFGDWDEIQTYWQQNGKGSSGLTSFARTSTGELYPVAERALVEDRDYLSQFSRTWGSQGRFSILSLDASNGLKDLQTNAYPYSNPVLTDDGQILAYISDLDSTNVEETAVCWTKRQPDGSFPSGEPISLGGYGDSQLKVAGDANFAAAVWVRQGEKLTKEAGQGVTESDVALMSNSTEVMASIYDGANWTTVKLTDNASPDMAPVVATNGSRVLVAWRSVYSADASDPLNFNTQDNILYRVFEGGAWGAPQALYNGTSGAVKGLEARMLADGTTAVAYTIDTVGTEFALGDETQGVNSGLEAVWAIVATDGLVARNVRLTHDRYLDENPQITSVTFDDNNEWFVMGWHSVHDADGVSVNDIRLCAFDRNGTLHPEFIDSISSVNEYAAVNISPNFRFVKNARTIHDLAILWSEPANGGDINKDSTLIDKDVLRAVKFADDGGHVYITSALDITEMPDFTLIDHFDAYTNAKDSVRAVILGTSYDNGYVPTGLLVEDEGEIVPLQTAITKSNLYTASAQFTNSVEVRSLAVDYGAVVRGMRIPVQFTIFNSGIQPVTSVSIQVGSNTDSFTDLYLLPNSSITLTAFYDIPGDRVVDPRYTVTATFGEDTGSKLLTLAASPVETFDLTETLYLAIPDVGISKLECLREQDGERLMQVALYNLSDVQLAGSNRIVKIGFYSDADLTKEVIAPIEVYSPEDLGLIDAGGYTKQVVFDIANYLGAGEEIPSGGVRIYAKAWVEEPLPDQPGETGEILEYYQGNNVKSILFESLLARNDGDPATISTEQTNDGGVTNATITVRNNSLVDASGGNLTVRLLDQRGDVLETLQSYEPEAPNQGLIELGPEGVAVREFAFTQQGYSLSVTYNNAIIADNTNARLGTLSLSEIPLKFEPGIDLYDVTVKDKTSTTVTAVAEDPKAKIDVNGSPLELGSAKVSLRSGLNEIVIRVTAADGLTTKEYVVRVDNQSTSAPAPRPTIVHNEGGSVTVSSTGRRVTAAPNPGYRVKDMLINEKSVGALTVYTAPTGLTIRRVEVVFERCSGLITVTQNSGGTVVVADDGLSITIAAAAGYRVGDVTVDGISVGAVNEYRFSAPAAPHLLNVTFIPILGTVTIVQHSGGTVGVTSDGLGVTITPLEGYQVVEVLVDGTSVGATTGCSFDDPSANHTVEAFFTPLPSGVTIVRHYGGSVSVSPDGLTLTVTPMEGYRIQDVLIDGASVGVVRTYTLAGPGTAHKVEATFAASQDVLANLTDVGNHWGKEAISFVVEHKLLVGTTATTFAPETPVTRAMLVTILMRLAGGKSGATSQFRDVEAGAWYEESVAWATANGIVGSVGDGRFAPDRPATREELATIFINYCRFAGVELPQTQKAPFADAGDIADWALVSVTQMQQAGLLAGKADYRFDPQATLTRAEFAAVLQRFITQVLEAQ
jgi:hypothetical protein